MSSSSQKARRERAYSAAVALVIEKQYTLERACAAVRQGTNIPTLSRWVRRAREDGPRAKAGRPCVLAPEQESVIAKRCLDYAARGAPVTKEELAALVQEQFGSNPSVLNRFRNGKPGKDWINGFCKRNDLSLKKPKRQAAVRYAATNAEVLTSHFDTLGRIYDELKGKKVPFRFNSLADGTRVLETVSSVLSSDSLLAAREDKPGMNSQLFIYWCSKFVERVSHLTANGRKVLLLYDGYRSHMSFKALQILSSGNIEAYALPANTSGSTQPLDVSVFSPYKTYINEYLYRTSSSLRSAKKVSQFDLCEAFNHAYNLAFSQKNIMKGFEKTGTWPFNTDKLLSCPLPRNSSNLKD
eukprot:IDg2436t1